MVSLVPADASRPTARTDRVAAVEGACSWGSPVYETVKLVRNPKTGKVDEKVYRFLVSAAVREILASCSFYFLRIRFFLEGCVLCARNDD